MCVFAARPSRLMSWARCTNELCWLSLWSPGAVPVVFFLL